MLDPGFSRSNFQSAPDHQRLCQRLSAVLTERIQAAANRHMEIEWIVADLRTLGHNVQHWDGVIANWETLDDPYVWIWFDRDDTVGVSFRPRLPEQARFNCPLCGSQMTGGEIRLSVRGHGSVSAPSVHVDFECPGLAELHGEVGRNR